MTIKLFAGLLLCCSVQAAELPWDLSYQSALREHPIADNEFMRIWPQRYPARQIHEQLAQYAGEPIEASVLIEKPDSHAGDPQASWFIKTRSSAKVCSYHPKIKASCAELEPAKVERFAREVLAFRPLPAQTDQKNTIGELEKGKPILVNYLGFISVYVDGKTLQRPLALIESRGLASPSAAREFGRVDDAMARATMLDADLAARQSKIDGANRSNAFDAAVQRGDVREMARLLDQAPDRGAELLAGGLALNSAAANGQQGAVELLLQRGSNINDDNSAALRAAAKAGNAGMVDFLLARGAQLDQPVDPKWPDKRMGPTPLSEAAAAGNEKMAALLIRRGAKVNAKISASVLAQAAGSLNYALVDLLLKNGAIADNLYSDEYETALMSAVQNAHRKGDSEAEQIARRLVAAGANVNYLGRTCATAYSLAGKYERPALQRALVDMGADPEADKRCMEKLFSGRAGGSTGTEAKARSVIIDELRRLLQAGDYAGVEKLYSKLDKEKVRTPAGAWGLSVFYAALRDYPQRTRDMAYWNAEDAKAAQWAAKFPRSDVATVFRVYLLQSRALSFRGNGNYADIRKEDLAPMQQAVKEALALLDKRPAKAPRPDGGWFHVRMEVLPYSELFDSHFSYAWEGGIRQFPDYHPLYFSAAFYSLPKWGGAPDGVERIARLASQGKGAEREFMYARVYWYLDQVQYHGKIFEDSPADWDRMKTSFDALVQAYPDPWNLNAYAYFACKAGDYDVMSSLLKRIDDKLIFTQWGSTGEAEYVRCARNVGADTRNFKADLAARNSRMQRAQYDRLLSYAVAQRERFRNEESLRALESADEIAHKLWKRTVMPVAYHKARALDNMAQFDKEIQVLQEGLKVQPGYSSALFQMGLAYEGLKRRDEARAQFAVVAARVREELATQPERTPAVQKELERMRKKMDEYGISTTGW
jgi:ankyrin repeat protein